MKKWTVAVLGVLLGALASASIAQEACVVLETAQIEALKAECRTLETGETCTLVEETVTRELLSETGVHAPTLLKVSDGLTIALVGTASLTSADTLPALVTVTNANSFEVNLRQGAGRNFPLAGVFAGGATGEADGKTADGQWLHLVQGAWVFAELVQVAGDLEALRVLDPTTTQLPPSTAYLLESTGDCALSGILFSTLGASEITVNGVLLAWESATVGFVSVSDSGLSVQVSAGELVATKNDESVLVTVEESAIVSIENPIRLEEAQVSLFENLPLALVVIEQDSPEAVVYRYLEARTRTNSADMQALSCAKWDSQALVQSQSFRAMNAQLQNVSCMASTPEGDAVTVSCEGVIRTVYNGQTRDWAISGYSLVQEEGEWRICGEAD